VDLKNNFPNQSWSPNPATNGLKSRLEFYKTVDDELKMPRCTQRLRGGYCILFLDAKFQPTLLASLRKLQTAVLYCRV